MAFKGAKSGSLSNAQKEALQTLLLNSIVTHQAEGDVVRDGSLEMDYAAVVIAEDGTVVYQEIV